MGGNPAKFFLGFTSMVFDVIFMTQHYYLYAHNNDRLQTEEATRREAQQAGGLPYTALLDNHAASY